MYKGIKLNFSKIGLLSLVLVIALAALGVGYAEWTESLTITGTVNTTELNVGLKFYYGVETSPYVTLSPILKWWWGDGVKSHTFTLGNVYPSFGSGSLLSHNYFFVIYIAENVGTIPAKVAAINITKPDWIEVSTYSEGVPQEAKEEAIAQIQASTEIPEEAKPDLIQAVEDDWSVGQVLTTTGWHRYAAIFMKLHILDTAPENSSGTVTISTVFVPWNQ